MIRTLLILIVSCFFVQGLSAQTELVITYENAGLDKPGDSAFTRYYDASFLPLPEAGDNQTWDYSEIPTAGLLRFVTAYLEPDKSVFPNASMALKTRYALSEFSLTGQSFYEMRETGEYYIGNRYDAASFDLGLGTLDVPEQTVPLSVGYTDLLLPASLGLDWSTASVSQLETRLTLSALGLDNALLVYQLTTTHHDTIIGAGTLILPTGQSFPALLRKESRTVLDSFFLNNQPAPTALLDLFGVEQGGVRRRDAYTFFSPGINAYVMTIYDMTIDENNLANRDMYFRDDLATSGVADRVAGDIPARLYPNPATGGTIAMEFEKSSNARWELVISNALGEKVQAVPVTRPAGNVRMQFEPGASMPNGTYFCEILDENGNRVAARSFMLTR